MAAQDSTSQAAAVVAEAKAEGAAVASSSPAIDFRSRTKIADLMVNSATFVGKQISVAGWIRDQR